MEPEHREDRPEDVAAERAAEATEEPRARRGAEDVRIEDQPSNATGDDES